MIHLQPEYPNFFMAGMVYDVYTENSSAMGINLHKLIHRLETQTDIVRVEVYEPSKPYAYVGEFTPNEYNSEYIRTIDEDGGDSFEGDDIGAAIDSLEFNIPRAYGGEWHSPYVNGSEPMEFVFDSVEKLLELREPFYGTEV